MSIHKDLSAGNIHTMANWVVANATARDALSVTPADVGKVCWQQSDDSFWLLKDDSPKTWTTLGLINYSKTARYTISGLLANNTGVLRWYPEVACTITSAYFSLGNAGTTGTTLTVMKNGSSTGLAPSAGSGNNKSNIATGSVSMATTDYITVNVSAGTSASNAVLTIVYQ